MREAAVIPVCVPTFNNPTYLRKMVGQLLDLGLDDIRVIDNGSTYPPMRDCLASVPQSVQVTLLGANLGPWHVFQDEQLYQSLPQYFCVTDADLEFSPVLPVTFITVLIGLTERHRIGKAGFALDISERDCLRDGDVVFGNHERRKIWEWEAPFWKEIVETLDSGDPVYAAPVDTTFAVYNKAYFHRNHWGSDHEHNNLSALRVGGKYTARHLPWYRESIVPPAEIAFYRAHAAPYLSHLPQ